MTILLYDLLLQHDIFIVKFFLQDLIQLAWKLNKNWISSFMAME